MQLTRGSALRAAVCGCALLAGLAGCNARVQEGHGATPPTPAASASAPLQAADDAPPPEKTGGFDGKQAFAHVAKLVGFGPRPSGSPAILQTQEYIQSQLKSYGCTVDTDTFSADTPAGRLPMKNIVTKIPGQMPGIILLGTHYDTKRLENFVGADDGGSSTGVMLELARLLCAQHGRYAVWIAFFDGEEAVKEWNETDGRYGSRQMAARLATNGDLRRIRAMLLADICGGRNLRMLRDSSSAKWLTDLVWSAAGKLGYGDIFVPQESSVEDDHDSFLKRGVPAVDVITDFLATGYWHTSQDTLDKISAKSLAIVGHVFLESLKQLQAN